MRIADASPHSSKRKARSGFIDFLIQQKLPLNCPTTPRLLPRPQHFVPLYCAGVWAYCLMWEGGRYGPKRRCFHIFPGLLTWTRWLGCRCDVVPHELVREGLTDWDIIANQGNGQRNHYCNDECAKRVQSCGRLWTCVCAHVLDLVSHISHCVGFLLLCCPLYNFFTFSLTLSRITSIGHSPSPLSFTLYHCFGE